MKKIMLFGAMALAGIMSSCSSDEAVTGPDNSENGLQEIKLGFGVGTTTSTRGTGTVGGSGESNVWNGQKFNVFMLNKGTVDLAMFEDEGAIYDNEVFIAPINAVSGPALPENNHVKYYPAQGEYDFWGYRLDDCATGNSETSADETQLLIPFKIDGSQDIMVGKAMPTQEDIDKCVSSNGIPQPERIYSAFAARRGIQPSITFSHLLTRLTFSVNTPNLTTASELAGISITGIEVVSKSTGKLIAAYTGNVTDRLVFDGTEEALSLKQRAKGADTNTRLVPLEPVTPLWDTDMNTPIDTPVGDALLVAPSDSYKIIVRLSQTVNDSYDENNPHIITKTFAYEDILEPKTAGGFKAGTSYNVKISIYGLCEIKLATTLTPWDDGGSIDMNPEENGTIIK